MSTIKQEFEEYVKAVYPLGTTLEQFQHIEQAFFAGVTLGSWFTLAGTDYKSDKIFAKAQQILAEVKAYQAMKIQQAKDN